MCVWNSENWTYRQRLRKKSKNSVARLYNVSRGANANFLGYVSIPKCHVAYASVFPTEVSSECLYFEVRVSILFRIERLSTIH